MKKNMQLLKIFILTLVIGLGVSFAFAWSGPSGTPPANNVEGIIDVSNVFQSKGYSFTSASPTVFDIDDANNINETFSTQSLAVWINMFINHDAYVNSLSGPNAVCSDPTGLLTVCP
jgi:hypothetical protein